MLERAYKITEELGIGYLLDHSIFDLSSGERQKLSLACALMTDPRMVIMDEPSANLDMATIDLLEGCIKNLVEEGFLVLVAEHRLFYLKDVCSQFLVLDGGKLVHESSGIDKVLQEGLQFELRTCKKEIDLSSRHMQEGGHEGRVNERNCKMDSDDDKPVLSLENVTYSQLLHDINLNIYRGKVLAISGANGIGKTTLARTLMGFDTMHKKQIKDPVLKKFREQSHPFFVMQESDYQLFAPTVREELNLTKKQSDEEHLKVLHSLGLMFHKEDFDRLPAGLSGGQKQRLVIALALLSDAQCIIFDEPSSGLDAQNMKRVARTLVDIAHKGKAVVVITHDFELLSLCADEVAFFDKEGLHPAIEVSPQNQRLFENYFFKNESQEKCQP